MDRGIVPLSQKRDTDMSLVDAYAPTPMIAWILGYDAYEAGETVADCPYPLWCNDAGSWIEGFNDAAMSWEN
jgi:hypothetical protein